MTEYVRVLPATCSLGMLGHRCGCEGRSPSHPTVEGQRERLVRDFEEGGLDRRNAELAADSIERSHFVERKQQNRW